MKTSLNFKLVIILAMTVSICLLSCAGSKIVNNPSTDSKDITLTEDEASPHDWATALRRVPGLKVTGNYPDLSILIRGRKSVNGSNEPLYVLDGVVLGRNFRELATSADPSNIKKVRVLKGPEAAKYGMRGAFGVIEVMLKD